MSGLDFDDIAALWREPNADDRAMMQKLARRARLQARLFAYGDIIIAILIIVFVALGTVMKPTPISAVAAVLMIATTLWMNWKRRAFRQMSRNLDTSDRATFLESSIGMARSNLRRVTFSLVTFPPLILLALVYRISVRDDPEFDNPVEAVAAWTVTPRGIFTIIVLSVLVAWMLRSRWRAKSELRRLREVREAYDDEARHGPTD